MCASARERMISSCRRAAARHRHTRRSRCNVSSSSGTSRSQRADRPRRVYISARPPTTNPPWPPGRRGAGHRTRRTGPQSRAGRRRSTWLPNGGMGLAGVLTHQLAALLGRQPLIQGRADQLIAEQSDRLRPLAALVLLQRHLLGSPLQWQGCNRLPGRRLGEDHRSSCAASGAIRVAQGQLRGEVQPGVSSRPPLAATATRSGVTAPSNPAAPKRNLIAAVAVATAANTSRHAQPVPSGILTSTPAATATPRNQTRTASSRDPARRSQPRTVAPEHLGSRRSGDAQPPRTGGQRSPNPFRRIRSAQKHHPRQQHVGDRARPAACPPPQPLDLSGPGIPPAAQHTDPTRRAADPTGRQPRLDVDRVSLYRHHRCLQPLQRGTPQAGQDFSGVPRTHQFLVTLTVHTNKINPATTPTATSAASMKKGHPVVVIQRDGQRLRGPAVCVNRPRRVKTMF